jgi:pimeloyl-ACP methyl ester carboxylesterase
MPTRLLFLPGASGNTRFWHPVADLLTHPGERIHYGWPGFGLMPPDPSITGIDGLVAKVVADIDRPTALIAQSMGGVIAMRAALEKSKLVTHLVLTVTSGGVDISDLGAQEWRESFQAANPTFPRWFADYKEDLTEQLKKINMPVVLLWGDADPISPVAVGQRLASLLPRAELHVIRGGDHDLANTCPHTVTPLIDEYLARSL